MKKILFVSVFALFVLLAACHETTIGYLKTEDASYKPDTVEIRKTPDPVLDAVRVENNSPWIFFRLQGYRGTDPIIFSVESVTSSEGEEADWGWRCVYIPFKKQCKTWLLYRVDTFDQRGI